MSIDAVLEALPTERLRVELTRKVAARLARAGGEGRTEVLLQSSLKRTARVSPAPTDIDIEIDGEHYLLQAKKGQSTGQELLEAVHGAVGELLGSAKLFILHASDPALVKVVSAVLEQLPEVVASRRQALSERNIEALVDVFLGTDPLTSAMPSIERDNAKAQAAFLKRWPVLTADAVAEQAEHASANRSATASRWKKAGKIFGMRVSGRELYPAFQFHEGRPRPIIAKVLSALPEGLSGWQTGFWFTGPNGWLDGQAPVDRLHDHEAVAAAAEHERDTWMG